MALTWTPHVRIAWGGQLGSSTEIWTNSIKWKYADTTTVPTSQDLTAMMDLVYTSLSAWFVSPGASISGVAHLSWIKANHIGANGKQAPGPTNEKTFTAIDGAAGGVAIPFYQTLALTMRTGLSRGRAHAGRIYPPMVSLSTNEDGYISAALATSAATAWATFLSQINPAIALVGPNPGIVCVLSPGDSTKGTDATWQTVTGVAVDRVMDVQHRRTNGLARLEGALAPVTG